MERAMSQAITGSKTTESDYYSFWLQKDISEIPVRKREAHPQGYDGQCDRQEIFGEKRLHFSNIGQNYLYGLKIAYIMTSLHFSSLGCCYFTTKVINCINHFTRTTGY